MANLNDDTMWLGIEYEWSKEACEHAIKYGNEDDLRFLLKESLKIIEKKR